MPTMPLRTLTLAALAATANAHGAVTHPKPRQAVDGSLSPWNGSVPAYPIPFGEHAPPLRSDLRAVLTRALHHTQTRRTGASRPRRTPRTRGSKPARTARRAFGSTMAATLAATSVMARPANRSPAATKSSSSTARKTAPLRPGRARASRRTRSSSRASTTRQRAR